MRNIRELGGFKMKRLQELLDNKNHLLEEFLTLNEKELVQFESGNFDRLDEFYFSREGILELIKYVDAEIEKCLADSASVANNEANKEVVAESLRIKDQYVERIVAQDLRILATIDAAKKEVLREMADLRKNKKAVGSYRSKDFKNILDEEI